MTIVKFVVTIHVLEEAEIRKFASASDCKSAGEGTLAEAVRAIINPSKPPVDSGYEILEETKAVATDADDIFLLKVAINVNDEQALTKEARERYESCWGDNLWRPGSLGEAAYEVMVASNASPSPTDIGFEIYDWAMVEDRPIVESEVGDDEDATPSASLH